MKRLCGNSASRSPCAIGPVRNPQPASTRFRIRAGSCIRLRDIHTHGWAAPSSAAAETVDCHGSLREDGRWLGGMQGHPHVRSAASSSAATAAVSCNGRYRGDGRRHGGMKPAAAAAGAGAADEASGAGGAGAAAAGAGGAGAADETSGAGVGGAGGSYGSNRNGGGGDDGLPGDKEEPAQRPPDSSSRRYPMWMKIWFIVTALFYLYARMQWRADLKVKMDEMDRAEKLHEREDREWDSFQEGYQGHAPSESTRR